MLAAVGVTGVSAATYVFAIAGVPAFDGILDVAGVPISVASGLAFASAPAIAAFSALMPSKLFYCDFACIHGSQEFFYLLHYSYCCTFLTQCMFIYTGV